MSISRTSYRAAISQRPYKTAVKPPPPPPRKISVKSACYNSPHWRERALRLLLVLACIVLLGILTLGRPGSVAAQGTPQGSLEFPAPNSFQSGIGFIAGWVCEAESVEIEIETTGGEVMRLEVAYGGQRANTQSICGDTDNDFGIPFNWNLLGDGEHMVVALVDGEELGRAVVTVTTVGEGAEEEFLQGAEGACVVEDFPLVGETVTLAWQETQQNFVMTSGLRPVGENRAGVAGEGYLENPGPNSFQSGIGFIAGWVCEATNVAIEINGISLGNAAYGGQRADTESICGDTDNGFGILFNWNRLGEGEHTVVAYVDEVELGRATVTVTTVGEGEEEFLRDVVGECVVEDFPTVGETVALEWQENSQNFVITDTSIGGPCLQTSASVAGRGFGLAEDCTTLLGLKDTLRGTASLNWADTLNMDSWDGITVSGTPAQVTELFLGNGLDGIIPPALGDLTHLVLLDLPGNALTGSIPSALSKLSNLEEFDLRSNQLTGAIPSALGNLSSLRQWALSGNALTGTIPAALGNLSNLTYLDLGDNQLTGAIPTALGNLSNLTHLDLGSYFPPFNALTGAIPPALGNLSNLESLDLRSNQLSGAIPAALGDLSNLTYLDLSNNQLTGPIPTELGDLSSLRNLYLASNQLTGPISAALSKLSNLEFLDLAFNQLTGPISAALSKLSNLEFLDLAFNQLSGTIPPELGNLSNLTYLDLSVNQLTGPIPSTLGDLSNLAHLDLSGFHPSPYLGLPNGANQLGGTIPAELGNLSNLAYLDLSKTVLTGTIPTALGNLSSLKHLDLSGNQLTGTIPSTLGNLSNLESLDLDSNQLTGTIPSTLGNLSSLESLDLDSNQLTGTILSTLGNLSSLERLNLSHNALTGAIPSALGNLSNLWRGSASVPTP